MARWNPYCPERRCRSISNSILTIHHPHLVQKNNTRRHPISSHSTRIRLNSSSESPIAQFSNMSNSVKEPSDFLKVQGDAIVLEGKPVILRGAGLGGWSELVEFLDRLLELSSRGPG